MPVQYFIITIACFRVRSALYRCVSFLDSENIAHSLPCIPRLQWGTSLVQEESELGHVLCLRRERGRGFPRADGLRLLLQGWGCQGLWFTAVPPQGDPRNSKGGTAIWFPQWCSSKLYRSVIAISLPSHWHSCIWLAAHHFFFLFCFLVFLNEKSFFEQVSPMRQLTSQLLKALWVHWAAHMAVLEKRAERRESRGWVPKPFTDSHAYGLWLAPICSCTQCVAIFAALKDELSLRRLL